MIFLILLQIFTQIIPDFQINSEDYPAKALQCMPAIANYDSGAIVIWYDMRMPCNGLRVFGIRLDALGDTIRGNFRINDDTTTGCVFFPDVSCDYQGNFIAVWIQNSNAMCRRFETDGTPMGSSFAVNDIQTSCYSSRVDVDSSGRVGIVWSDGREGQNRIYCQIYDESGIPVGVNFPVSDSLQYMSMLCDLSINSNKGITVIWAYDNDVWCQRLDSLGNRIGGNFRVWNDTLGIDEGYPAIRYSKDGNFLVSWSTQQRGDVYCRLFDSTASPITDVITLNEAPLIHSWKPKVTYVHDSLWFVVWYDSISTVYLQRISSSGSLIGNNIQINEPVGMWNHTPDIGVSDSIIIVTWNRKITSFVWDIIVQQVSPAGNLIGQNRIITDDKGGSPQYWPAVVADTAGNFFIVWDDFRNPESGYSDQYGRRFNTHGIPLEDDFRINDYSDAGRSSITLNDLGLYVTVWARTYPDSNQQIYGQRFDYNGTLLGPNFQISQAPGNTGVDFPEISTLSSDRFITIWSDHRVFPTKVYGRLLDSLGLPYGSEFTAYIDSTANNSFCSIVDEENGKFLLGMSCDQELIGVAIQEFDYDANPVSAPIILNDIPTKDVIVSGAKGLDKYLFVWAGFDDINIYGQLLNDSLQKIGGNFLVSDDTVNYKGFPSVVSSSNGKFFVVWHDARNGYNDVYGQFFDSLGNKIADNFRVDNDTTNSDQWMPSCYAKNSLIYIVWSDARIPSHWYDIYCKVIEWPQTYIYEDNTTIAQSVIVLSPNPFRKIININLGVALGMENIELKIYDVAGRLVKKFSFPSANILLPTLIEWDGRDDNANLLPAGVYFVKLNYDSGNIVKKVVKIR